MRDLVPSGGIAGAEKKLSHFPISADAGGCRLDGTASPVVVDLVDGFHQPGILFQGRGLLGFPKGEGEYLFRLDSGEHHSCFLISKSGPVNHPEATRSLLDQFAGMRGRPADGLTEKVIILSIFFLEPVGHQKHMDPVCYRVLFPELFSSPGNILSQGFF